MTRMTCIRVTLFFMFGIALAAGADKGAFAEDERGRIKALTYNVAGLPEIISQSHPSVHSGRISPRLNDFDLALVQEDFYYHEELSSKTDHQYSSPPGTEGTLGDGLARFSRFPIKGGVEHVSWQECHGHLFYANDCLTKKGFAMGVHQIAPGITVHVYNLHMDASGSKGDQETRSKQMDQLIAYMNEHSKGMPLIVAGDFNLYGKRPRDLEVLKRLLESQGLKDACRQMKCGEERIDRVLFRGNQSVEFHVTDYKVEVQRFQTPKGKQLSDHEAVSAVIEWKAMK